MSVQKLNILWKSFKGIRTLNSINSDSELGADVAMNVRLSKEKSGQFRSIKSSGWFNDYAVAPEKVIRLFAANMSVGNNVGANQLIAFTKTSSNINAWLIEDDGGVYSTPVKVATFNTAEDVTDAKMVQFGDRLVVACAFGNNTLGFICYSADSLAGWTDAADNFKYRQESITESTTGQSVDKISSIAQYGSRIAINGFTQYKSADATGKTESIFGVWFSEAGNPINFTSDYITKATDTSAFFVEVGEYANKIIEYNGLTVGCRNHMFNVSGNTQSTYKVEPLTAKGVFGNAMFVVNGDCAYVDSYENNIFILKNNIDGTIGFDAPVGDDIQEYVSDMKNVTINTFDRRVRIMKETGESLVFDVDISEWTTEIFSPGARAVTFLGKELMCDKTTDIKQITTFRQPSSRQLPNEKGYYSHFKTNLIWLDSQTSVKSHIYPFAIVLEPQTNNDFFIKFTVDRKTSYVARVVRAGYENIATYSQNDSVPKDGSKFVASDDDLTGRVFFASSGGDLLVTVDRPPYWRYLQIEIYSDTPGMEFNVTGIEAKQTFIDDEQLDY